MKSIGCVYFWKYKTDGWLGNEWHCTADSYGCDYLLEVLTRITCSDVPMKVEIVLTPVNQSVLDIPEYNSPFENMQVLRFLYSPAASSFYEWSIAENGSTAEITLGKAMLNEWQRAVDDVKNGQSGYSIGLHEDYTVSFWTFEKSNQV